MATGPLEGIKVIEYCGFVAGPHCAKQLADLGAEVIKVEPVEGDEARRRGPFKDDAPNPETSGVFLYSNTNKKGVTLNTETAEGKKIFKALIAGADVLIEDKAPGEMKRLGLDYEVLSGINPGLIMASITPFGQYGPYSDYKAYYLNTYHASGAGYVLPANSPNAEREPIKGGGYVGERDIGVCTAVAVLGAVYNKLLGGSGQYIDISKQEAEMELERLNIARFYELGKSPTRVKISRLRDVLLHCKDDNYVKIVLHPDRQWEGVCRALGNPEWTKLEMFRNHEGREANYEILTEYLSKEAESFTADELFARVQAEGTACAPTCSAEQVYNSPQTAVREFYVDIDHPVTGTIKYPGVPVRYSESMPAENFGAPLLGQHNEEIYCQRLNYSKQDLIKLREAGVI